MFENIRRNKIRTLEPKRNLVVNDINLKDYDMGSVSTVIAVSAIFLLSMKLFVITGI